jgi:FtsZ-binding cell division protein ZapB
MIKRIPTSAVSFTINKGVPYIPPETPSDGAWEEITTAISSLRASLNDEITALETDVTSLKTSVETAQGNINSLKSTAEDLQDQIDGAAEDITAIGGRVTTLETDVGTLGTDVATLEDRIDGIYSASGFFRWSSDYTVATYEELEEGDFIPRDDNGDYIYDGQLYRVRSSGKYVDDEETELDFPSNALFAFDVVTARWYPIGGDDTPIDTSELVTKEEFNSTIGDLSTILEMLNNGGIT